MVKFSMPKYRTPKFLSPSALSKWEERGETYFVQYICPREVRPDREPQTGPQSVGSAFDALVKSDLNRNLNLALEGFSLRELVAEQCEPHTLPESLEIACILYDQYRRCGAYANLLELIRQSRVPGSIKMEYSLTSNVNGVPMMGKPDLHFLTGGHAHVITDWKVSGAVSKCGVSPQQGYQLALDVNESRTHGKAHKKYEPVDHPGGIEVNGLKMNATTDYWADQLATYAWSLGEPVGSENWVARIEQIAVRPGYRAKCVVHQSTVDGDYQRELFERYERAWHHISTGHYFPELPRAQSDARAEMIVRQLTAPFDVSEISLGTLPPMNWNQ